MKHRHKPQPNKTIERCYSAPVSIGKQNRMAHGGVCYIETCQCGATRKKNVNQCHIERGEWSE